MVDRTHPPSTTAHRVTNWRLISGGRRYVAALLLVVVFCALITIDFF